jgi:hypothetical protein
LRNVALYQFKIGVRFGYLRYFHFCHDVSLQRPRPKNGGRLQLAMQDLDAAETERSHPKYAENAAPLKAGEATVDGNNSGN